MEGLRDCNTLEEMLTKAKQVQVLKLLRKRSAKLMYKLKMCPSQNLKNFEVALDVDLTNVLAKVNVQVPLLERAKLGPQRGQVRKAFNFEEEPEDPLFILQTCILIKRMEDMSHSCCL